jgi:hypothetical protein
METHAANAVRIQQVQESPENTALLRLCRTMGAQCLH